MLALCGAPVRVVVEPILTGQRLLRPGESANVSAVGHLIARLYVVSPKYIEDAINALLQSTIENGRGHLDTAKGVAGHPVCRSDVVASIVAVAEDIDAAVLKEASHDADDVDVIGKAGHSTSQAADATDHHIDLDACLACFQQLVHERLIGQRIHFEPDMPEAAAARLLDLSVDQIDQL